MNMYRNFMQVALSKWRLIDKIQAYQAYTRIPAHEYVWTTGVMHEQACETDASVFHITG